MTKLQTIIQKVVTHFQVIVINSYDEQRDIYKAEIITPQTLFDPHTLYLCADPSSLPKNDLQKNCCLMTTESRHTPFSIIQLTKQPDVLILCRFINDVIHFEALIESQTNQLYHSLHKGNGLKDVVALAEEFFGYPISVCDASYNLIETSPLMKQMQYGLSQFDSRTVLASEEVESLKRHKVIEQIYRSSKAFGVRTPDHPDNQWIFCGIRLQNVLTGYVAVCMGDRDTNEYILRMATILADICAIEMQKHDFFVTRTGMKYENFLIDLLEGKFSDVNMISSRLELLDRKFCKYFCVIVLTCMEPHDSDLFNKQQMTALRASYPNSMSVVYKDSIVLFLNQNDPIPLTHEFFEKLLAFCKLNHMKAGFSQPFSDILKIHDYYIQATGALSLGELTNPENILHFATFLLPQYLFSRVETTGLASGIHHHIPQLQAYDQEFHTEFVLTLRSYLDNDRNATKAADALHIHRSTFFYRIKKIEELLDISITDSRLLFLYELSFMIWDYLC